MLFFSFSHLPATVFPKLVLCMITTYENKDALWHYNHLNRCTHELFFYLSHYIYMWLNFRLSPVKLSHVNLILRLARQHRRRQWHPTPVLLPGKSHGQRSSVGCSPWGHRVGHDWSDLAAAVAARRHRRGEENVFFPDNLEMLK